MLCTVPLCSEQVTNCAASCSLETRIISHIALFGAAPRMHIVVHHVDHIISYAFPAEACKSACPAKVQQLADLNLQSKHLSLDS